MPTPKPGRIRVSFNDAWLAEDLHGASTTAQNIARETRERLERDGVTFASPPLRHCDAEARDGTRLAGCLKLYVPEAADPTASPWGLVFRVARDDHGLFLRALAFGVRHPPENSNKPTVYQLADKRLNG